MKDSSSGSASIRKVAIASFVGTTIEWYDFFLYGTASALIFNRLFFPNYDPMLGTLASFGTYAVGFAARPIGGIVCGHFGDRLGRKSMLILTLLIMGIATSLIGLLPTYNQIGIWAPVLLIILRLAQGFAVGGEWGGAVLMAVEHAPKGRRGFYGSWPQIGVPAGLLLSTVIFGQISKLPEEAMLSWGWRVAFLLSILLVGVGLFIRLTVVEPPAFIEIKQARTESRVPLFDTIRHHPGNLILAMGARIADNATFYLYTVFILAYGVLPQIGFSRISLLNAISIAAILDIFSIPAYGWLSDKVGRRPVYLFGAIFTGLLAFPFYRPATPRYNGPLYILSAAIGSLGAFLPGFLGTWVKAYQSHPGLFFLIATAFAGILFIGGKLQGKIFDYMRTVFDTPVSEAERIAAPPSNAIYWLRSNKALRKISRWLKEKFVPWIILAIVAMFILRSIFIMIESSGLVCKPIHTQPPDSTQERIFPNTDICWDSGSEVAEGKSYRITMTINGPGQDEWKDKTINTSIGGHNAWYLIPFIPLRRHITEPWFKPIARIGEYGTEEYPLDAVNGSASDSNTLIAEIKARKGGKLYLFVNDAVLPVPNAWQVFYKNNRGTASVKIEQLD